MMDSLERASGELERLSKEKGQRKEMSQSQRARDTEGEKKEAEGDNEMVVVEVRGFSFSAELHDADNSEVINIEGKKSSFLQNHDDCPFLAVL